jgi:hypothetical protein
MKLAHQLLETALVLVSGIFAYFYFMWKFGKDVFFTTGARVVEIWRRA